MSITDSSNFIIEGSTFNNVHGNQVNYNRIVRKVNVPTPYDEYINVKTGALHLLREIHCDSYPRNVPSKAGARADRTIYTTEIRREQGSIFTAVAYSGPDASKAWDEDFRKFSRSRNSNNFQLFGINRSTVPWLIFYGDLVPVAHIKDKIGMVTQAYISTIIEKLGCRSAQVWIDPKQGALIKGLNGPRPLGLRGITLDISVLPSSIEFFQEDLFLRYLSHLPLNRKLDRDVVHMLSLKGCIDISPITNQPSVISRSRKRVIAVGSAVWSSTWGCLDSVVVMPDGTTRFHLRDNGNVLIQLRSGWYADKCAWLSQASCIFHKLGISFDEDLSNLKLILPQLKLEGQIADSIIMQQRRQAHPAIYLFIPPFCFARLLKHRSTMSLHFWSFDESGRTRIPKHKCRRLGLPTQFRVFVRPCELQSWSAETYMTIHKWQVDRGFGSKTTDFAHFLGYPAYTVKYPRSNGDLSLDKLFYDTQVQTQEETSTAIPSLQHGHHQPLPSVWSTLITPFTWSAVDGADIPSFAL